MNTCSRVAALLLSGFACVCVLADVECSVSTTNGSVASCSAVYNQTVTLHCSLSGGYWFKDGSTHSVCLQSVCTLNNLSFIASSGLYYCKTNVSIVFLNLTVKAPPEFIPFPNHTLTRTSDGYYYPLVSVTTAYSKPFVNLQVRVVGVGPFSASWHLNNSDQEFCPQGGQNASVDCSQRQVTDTETVFTVSLKSVAMPLQQWMVGVYSAVVTNEYGSNTSKIVFQIICAQDPDEPRLVYPLHYTSYLNFTGHADASLYCQVVVFHLANLVMCYRYGNETSASVLESNYTDTRCAVCSFDHNGGCDGHLDGKEEWSVAQKKYGGCYENRLVILNISTVTDDDDGITIFCGYHINAEDASVLAEFDVHVTGAPFDWELFVFCSLAGLILALTLTTLSVVYMCYVKQSRRKMKKSRDKMTERQSKWLRDSFANDSVKSSDSVHLSFSTKSYTYTQNYGAIQDQTDYPPSQIPALSMCLNSTRKNV